MPPLDRPGYPSAHQDLALMVELPEKETLAVGKSVFSSGSSGDWKERVST